MFDIGAVRSHIYMPCEGHKAIVPYRSYPYDKSFLLDSVSILEDEDIYMSWSCLGLQVRFVSGYNLPSQRVLSNNESLKKGKQET